MTSVPVPAAMPSVEEMLASYNAVWQHALGIDAHNAPIVRHEAMSAVLALFAPILAEKEAQIVAGRVMTQKMRELATRQKAAGTEYYNRALAAEAALAGVSATIDEWSKPQTMKLRAGEMTAGEVRTTQAILKGLAAAIRAQGE